MTSLLLRTAGLAAIYLLVLTSVAPGDILTGGLVAFAIVMVSRSRLSRRGGVAWGSWLLGLIGTLASTGREMVIGTARVVRFCLAPRTGSAPGFVEIPRGDRSRRAVALWGVLTGEAPDEYPVHVDDARHVLIVHLIDARDPDAVRARHKAARERWQRHVVP
jgi:multisubunit Na+/H+ antiporter MnhE subunit